MKMSEVRHPHPYRLEGKYIYACVCNLVVPFNPIKDGPSEDLIIA